MRRYFLLCNLLLDYLRLGGLYTQADMSELVKCDMNEKTPELHVFVGSKNPVKIGAVLDAFQKTFPQATVTILGFDVESGKAFR